MMFSGNSTNHIKILCPQGPAGTGKTETMKDLAKLSGYDPIVVNACEQFELNSFKKIIEAETSKNSMLIIDEFNRIPLEAMNSMLE